MGRTRRRPPCWTAASRGVARAFVAALGILGVAGFAPLGGLDAQTLPGEVTASQFISSFEGGFAAPLGSDDNFGRAIALLGDVDGDGRREIAVGAPNDDDGGFDTGAVWILTVRPDGTTSIRAKLGGTTPGLMGAVTPGGHFGISVAAAGDLDDDGTPDLLVGASGDGAAAFNGGTLWIVLLEPDFTVRQAIRIDPTTVPLLPPLIAYSAFGISVAVLGDLGDDGTTEIAVGASGDGPELGDAIGAVFVLSLDAALDVTSVVKLGGTAGGLPWELQSSDLFGFAVCALGDLDGDGVPDMAVHSNDQLFGTGGAAHVLFLAPDASVKAHTRIANDGAAGFIATLGVFDNFADSLSALGDLDHDGVVDLAAGASRAPGGFTFDDGAVFVLFLSPDGTVKASTKIAPGGIGGFAGSPTAQYQHFGRAIAPLDDIDADGDLDMVVGMPSYPYVVKFNGFWGSIYTLRLTDGQWVPLGAGLAGTLGTPAFTGSGVPLADRPVELRLDGALPLSPTFVVAGLTQANVPFKGGTLVPSLDIVIASTTNASGALVVTTPWPAVVPAGTTLALQAWVVDAGAIAGWAASNGLLVTSP